LSRAIAPKSKSPEVPRPLNIFFSRGNVIANLPDQCDAVHGKEHRGVLHYKKVSYRDKDIPDRGTIPH
jgi:hypothetical protein